MEETEIIAIYQGTDYLRLCCLLWSSHIHSKVDWFIFVSKRLRKAWWRFLKHKLDASPNWNMHHPDRTIPLKMCPPYLWKLFILHHLNSLYSYRSKVMFLLLELQKWFISFEMPIPNWNIPLLLILFSIKQQLSHGEESMVTLRTPKPDVL